MHVFAKKCSDLVHVGKGLDLSSKGFIKFNTFPHLDAFAADDFRKHCDKRRNCSKLLYRFFILSKSSPADLLDVGKGKKI